VTLPVIGFAGLTHLGLVSAAAAAAKGFRVIGFDEDAARVAAISAGRLPVLEPDLDDLLAKHRDRLTFADSPAMLAACDLVYIATDVPTDDRGGSDLARIDRLVTVVAAALKKTGILTMLCQVPPGYTRRVAWPSRQLYYQVETLVFGRAVERATRPERYIVGCADPGENLPPALASVLGAYGCPILPMRYESAELAKISINCCLVAAVTVANTLAELSERIGADWREIVPALKLDKRIGAFAYLAPGLGIAGGNLERDLATVLRFAEATGSEASVIAAFLTNSAHRRDWVLRTLHREVFAARPEAALAILGLAYKENTHSTKNSPALALIAALGPWRLALYDPAVPASVADHGRATAVGSALDAAQGADALVIMTPWPEFARLDPAALAQRMAGRVVIDPFAILDGHAVRAAGLDYFTLGAPSPRHFGELHHA
jgi:UDPglucose 6-dehydrogenase